MATSNKYRTFAWTPPDTVTSQQYDCPVCGGLGMVRYDVEYGHPDFGRMMACPNPDCEAANENRKRVFARRFKETGVPDHFEDFTLATWEASLTQEQAEGKYIARSVAELVIETSGGFFRLGDAYRRLGAQPPAVIFANDDRCNSVVFYGPFGTTKTGLAVSIVNVLTADGVVCLYVHMLELIEAIHRRYERGRRTRDDEDYDDNWGNVSSGSIIDTCQTVPFLVIDEFNLSNMTPDREEKAEMIIVGRHMRSLPTLITTNLETVDEMKREWGERTVHKLREKYHMVEVGGVSVRRQAIPVGDND